MTALVASVSAGPVHSFSKPCTPRIDLIAGLGVDGDAHNGVTVRHRSRVARDPTQPNLRQVHLLSAELLAELNGRGLDLLPGDIGENVLTERIDLLALSAGTRLRLGPGAVVEVTGLRNPCAQLDRFRPGLMAATLDRDVAGSLVRKARIMAVVVHGGPVRPGDSILVEPPPRHMPLQPV